MSDATAIQWCDSTVNPVMGCMGCELWSKKRDVLPRCYAAALHDGRMAGVSRGFAPWFGLPTLFPGRMAKASRLPDLTGTNRAKKPWLNGLPRLIFTSDMADALSTGEYLWARDLEEYEKEGKRRYRAAEGTTMDGGVPFQFLEAEIVDVATSRMGARHIWQWLTKLPGRAVDFSKWLANERGKTWPRNLWIGASVTSRDSLGRVRKLLEVGDKTTLRFLSVEPLWGPISVKEWLAPEGVSWVIMGGESKQGDTPVHEFRLEWARTLLAECRGSGVPFFLKQLGSAVTDNGERNTLSDSHGGNWEEWPEDLQVRELPRRP